MDIKAPAINRNLFSPPDLGAEVEMFISAPNRIITSSSQSLFSMQETFGKNSAEALQAELNML